MPLHVKDINVENDEVHGPLFVVLETWDENETFQLQDNLNDSHDPIVNNHDKRCKFHQLI